MAQGKYDIDMTTGPLLKKILAFAAPMMLTGILQLLYNAADVAVVGSFAGKEALAAVGSTGALINLIVNVIMGLSVGSSVMIARRLGSHDDDGVRRAVNTSMLVAVIGGLLVMVVGIAFSGLFLSLMATPDDVLPLATKYMRIYFIGAPASVVYNFGASVLRANGDTRRPLYFLIVSGAVNVLFNLLFVIGFNMDVDGIATATVISQVLSAIFVIVAMMKMTTASRLEIKALKIYKQEFFEMLRIGLPAGIQGSIFSISNVLIQSAVNSFDNSSIIAGNAAAGNLEGFIYVAMNTFYHAALTFTGQNYGAKQFKRINKVLAECLITVTVVGLAVGMVIELANGQLLKLYTNDPEIIRYAQSRNAIICPTYFLCGIMEVMVGMLRGLGYSIAPMIVSIAGVCGIRIAWIYIVFAADPSIQSLYMSYPVSWLITAAIHSVCFIAVRKSAERRMLAQQC